MLVTFISSGKAFLPEMDAYKRYLEARGVCVRIQGEPNENSPVVDGICYRFAGLLLRNKFIRCPEVHEYHSASVGSLSRLKNHAKSVLACEPVGRVFLSKFVEAQFSFRHKRSTLYRDMGASEAFFAQRGSGKKIFDIVYAGSIKGRSGVVQAVLSLAKLGLRCGVAGSASEQDVKKLRRARNVHYVGRIPLSDVPEFISSGRFGLNYCPDAYPFNQQTSTKVIEYLAAGIPIISNSYAWMDSHARSHGYEYLNLDGITRWSETPPNAVMPIGQAREFLWDNILETSGLFEFLTGHLQG